MSLLQQSQRKWEAIEHHTRKAPLFWLFSTDGSNSLWNERWTKAAAEWMRSGAICRWICLIPVSQKRSIAFIWRNCNTFSGKRVHQHQESGKWTLWKQQGENEIIPITSHLLIREMPQWGDGKWSQEMCATVVPESLNLYFCWTWNSACFPCLGICKVD